MFTSNDGLCGIGELAEGAGVTVKTVRFYSDRGLLPEASRSAGGHRRYGPEALDRLRLIRSLRALGLGVPEVRRILDERHAHGTAGGEGGALEAAVAGRLREVGSELRALRWREAALRLVQEAPPGEQADRLRLIGAVSVPPSTAPLVRFWRGWLPARMPARSAGAFLDVAVPQPPDEPAPAQVLAFARLNALTLAPCRPGTVQPQPEAHRAAGARGPPCCTRGSRRRTSWPGCTCAAAGNRTRVRPWTRSSPRTRARTGCGTPPASAAGWPGSSPPTPGWTATGSWWPK